MPYFYYGIQGDSTYSLSIILLIVGVIISFYAQAKVKGNFNKYSKVRSVLNGEQAARRLLEQNGIAVNGEKVGLDKVITETDFKDGELLIKKGKKTFLKVILG